MQLHSTWSVPPPLTPQPCLCVLCCRDQDDYYGFFAGEHAMVRGGYGSIVNQLADGLDVQLGHTVTHVAYQMPGQCTVASVDEHGNR